MILIKTISELKTKLNLIRNEGKTIGLVPTMGYLHKGHTSLIEASAKESDITLVTIFVNPTQFGPGEDFERYPRNIKRDIDMAKLAGADMIFSPEITEVYPDGYSTYVEVEGITNALCGKTRPQHFRGVTTIVNKLFNIIQPHRAYFGQKDAQQVVVVKKMVSDLNMDVDIIVCPIVREEDGLAISSRNVYLSPGERNSATILSKALFKAHKIIKKGERNAENILDSITRTIKLEKGAQIEYIALVDVNTLGPIDFLSGKVLIALAVKFGRTRLIDNIIVEV
ncbi:MAG: pantoate--beta-alanine ligase [Clostridium sp.]|nr:pantoate--beta-alanine ligase [Clostridium sp.]